MKRKIEPKIPHNASIIVLTLTLMVGAVIAAYGATFTTEKKAWDHKVSEIFKPTKEIAGWDIRTESMANSPEQEKTVSRLLNYDQAVFQSYIRGSERISIYIAHWRAGKAQHRVVAAHTPDTCWVSSGWEIVEASETKQFGNINTQFPGAVRLMRRKEVIEWVVFWHLVGSRCNTYGIGAPPWYATFADIFRHGLSQREEQMIIRISGTASPESLVRSEPVLSLILQLRSLGLPI